MKPQSEAPNWTSRFGFVDIQQRLELCQRCQFGSSCLSGDLILDLISPEIGAYVAIAPGTGSGSLNNQASRPPYCDGTVTGSLLLQVRWDQQSVWVVFSSKDLSANAY